MGIRGLAGFIKWKAADSRRALIWESHRGETWAIDCACLLYRARAASLSPLTVIAALLVRLRQAGITPIVIFDGRPPASKSDTIEQRREQRETAQKEIDSLEHDMETSDMTHMHKAITEKRVAELKKQVPHVSVGDKDQVKQLLYGAGVLFVSASGEADDMLGYLARANEVQAVLSTDMDMLARGVSCLIVPETNDAAVMTEIRTERILSALRLTYAQFVDACVLMGTDYTGRGFKTVAPPAAVELARRGVCWAKMESGEECAAAAQSLRGDNVSWSSFLSGTQSVRWSAGAPPREPETIARMCQEQGWPPSWAIIL